MSLVESLKARVAGLEGRLLNAWFTRGQSPEDYPGRTWELNVAEQSAAYVARAQDCGGEDLVDDRTWSDLELDKVCVRLDKAVSPSGAQYLYSMLRVYQSNPQALEQNARLFREFKARPASADRLREALRGLNRPDGALLAGFLSGTPPIAPTPRRIFYVLSALSLACPFGMILSPWFLWPTLGLWLTNIILHFTYGRRVIGYGTALKSLAVLLASAPEVAEAVEALDVVETGELNQLLGMVAEVRKGISRAFLRSVGRDDFTAILVEYLNLLCLFELSALCRAIEAVNRERPALAKLYRIISRLDAFQGLVAAVSAHPCVCVPQFREGRSLSLQDVYHPLLDRAISNTIETQGSSVLLSGSNMSGKTTFIKTLGVNLVLAQTLGLCLARAAVVPRARVRTLIDRQDSITSGQSYFFFEAAEVLKMLREAGSAGRPHCFVLDEVFRGTNAVERVAAGAAVLSELHRCGFVVASTHDFELTNLLAAEFAPYHFSEVINGKEARFDYRLRTGPCTTRNALRLLEMAGYPERVLEQAQKLAAPNPAQSPTNAPVS